MAELLDLGCVLLLQLAAQVVASAVLLVDLLGQQHVERLVLDLLLVGRARVLALALALLPVVGGLAID